MENLLTFPNNSSAPVPAGCRLQFNRLRTLLQPNCFPADLKGNVVWTAMDPYGFQFLNQKLQDRKPEDIQSIFSELKDNICILMFDRIGSHVSQKLFQVCDEEQMTQLVSSITAYVPFLMVVCCNSQGSESLKKFLDCLKTPKQISDMMSAFQQLTLPLVNHRIGSGVISHCFRIFPIPAQETKPILDVITDNFLEIATNSSGSSLLREVFDSKVFLLESRLPIISAVIENAYQLSQHQFGYSVVRWVINFGMHDDVRDIVAKLRSDFASLSMVKYARLVAMTLIYKALEIKEEEKCPPQFIYDLIISPNFWKVYLEPYHKFDLQCAEECYVGTLCEALHHLQNQSDGKKTVLHK